MSAIKQGLLDGTYKFTVNKNDFRTEVFKANLFPVKLGFYVIPKFESGVFSLKFKLLYKDNLNNEVQMQDIDPLTGINSYSVDPNTNSIDGFDRAMFTKVQFETIALFTSDEIVFSGAEVIYGESSYPNVNPTTPYFTFKLECGESEAPNPSFTTLGEGLMVAGVEIAAPCPPIWRD